MTHLVILISLTDLVYFDEYNIHLCKIRMNLQIVSMDISAIQQINDHLS